MSAEELVAHCRKRIGGYKIPRQYAFLSELPKSAMGKILKTALRDTYSDPGAEREVGGGGRGRPSRRGFETQCCALLLSPSSG